MAVLSKGSNDNDLAFGGGHKCILRSLEPNINEVNVPVTIFSDEQPENTEAAQLTLEAYTEDTGGVFSSWFYILPENRTFTILIEDDDRMLLACIQLI